MSSKIEHVSEAQPRMTMKTPTDTNEDTKTAPGLLPQADRSPALAGLIARLEKAAEDEKTNAEKCHWMKHRSHHMTKRAAFLEAAAMARQCLGS